MFKVRDLERVYIEQKKEVMYLNAKKYLQQLHRLDDLIKSNQQELAELRDLATSVGAIDYSKDRVQGSPSSDAAFVKIIFSIIDLETAINSDIEKMFALKNEVRTVINQIQDADEKLLLRLRYVHFEDWKTICDKLDVSMRTVLRIHVSALNSVSVQNNDTR